MCRTEKTKLRTKDNILQSKLAICDMLFHNVDCEDDDNTFGFDDLKVSANALLVKAQ